MGVLVPSQREWETPRPIQWLELQPEGRVSGEYDFEFCCGYDNEQVFPLDRHPASVLGRIVRRPSSPRVTSCDEEVTLSAEDGVAANASNNRTLQHECESMSIVE
jgi:hypothetical protein